jgi:hypothetical protein
MGDLYGLRYSIDGSGSGMPLGTCRRTRVEPYSQLTSPSAPSVASGAWTVFRRNLLRTTVSANFKFLIRIWIWILNSTAMAGLAYHLTQVGSYLSMGLPEFHLSYMVSIYFLQEKIIHSLVDGILPGLPINSICLSFVLCSR